MAEQQQPNLSRFLAANYETVKNLHPGEGRRKWQLRVAQWFFALSDADKAAYAQLPPVSEDEADEAPYTTDDDPLDAISTDAPGLGVVLRTDFSDESAWQTFLAKLKDAESEFAAEVDAPMDADSKDAEGEEMDEDDEDDEEEAAGSAPIFSVVNEASAHARLEGISNLAALRLLNDVDVRRIPDPPSGTKRIKPPNRLVDFHGWQEVYAGKRVWVYDAKSNQDLSVRVVSQQSAEGVYGTATADSWRARVTHICELQVNLASGAMSIDFGGTDRWDYPERVRNMAEAEQQNGA